MLDRVIKANTNNSLTEILLGSLFVKNEISSKKISIVSAFYETSNGIVTFEEF